MRGTWRWFGPRDAISLEQIKQTGATGIVTALHHLYHGEPWPVEEVLKCKAEIEAHDLVWSVVESIPVHNSIKLRSGPYRQYIGWWKESLRAIGEAGIGIVCYNFMPAVDWTRTDLMWRLPSGGYALRFDVLDFAAYDLFILKRDGAEADYSDDRILSARERFDHMMPDRRNRLEQAIIAGLPAAEAAYDRKTLAHALSEYRTMNAADLRAHLIAFLTEVLPVAEENGIRLAIHPDDPPWPLFGLPRVVSTAEDAEAILKACSTPANGLTFCVGSYGARADNDLLSMAEKFASKICFAHLRQVKREDDGSFYEAEHLEGSSDIIGVIRVLLREEQRRYRKDGNSHEIPMRPDHGHLLLPDSSQNESPGYSLIGRFKGLAELRGVIRGLEYTEQHMHETPLTKDFSGHLS